MVGLLFYEFLSSAKQLFTIFMELYVKSENCNLKKIRQIYLGEIRQEHTYHI